MLKKLLFTSLCTVALATSGFAVELKIQGDLEAYYKMQTDHRGPLDSSDFLNAHGETYTDGADERSGANNRSSQNVRAHGNIDFIGLAGENDFEGTTWYDFIAFARLTIDANDPDDNYGDRITDGGFNNKAYPGDLWLRYAPLPMLGIKIGNQTVVATANAAGIGHKFVGDRDEDYIYYTAGVLDEKPGITVDFHLSKDMELGVGMLQGMGDLSTIVTGGAASQASATVAWFKGNFGMIEATVGYQTVAVGDTEDATIDTDDFDTAIGKWKHEYKHTIMNAVLKVNVGDFSPFIGYQSAAGDMVNARGGDDLKTIDDTLAQLAAAGLTVKRINNLMTTRDIQLSAITLGLIANLGPGKLAAEYSQMSTPEFGEDAYTNAALEAGSTLHVNYVYPIAENATITAFYNAFTAKEDSALREEIDVMLDGTNSTAIDTAQGLGSLTAAQASTLKAGLTKAGYGYAALVTTSHSSIGVSFQMKFGD